MESKTRYRLKLSRAKEIVCISNSREEYRLAGKDLQINILKDSSVVVGLDGRIVKIGPAEELDTLFPNDTIDCVIDCSKYCVLPGLVDAHTHALFLGDRSKEFDMKLHGKNYVDIYNEGLGIRFTMDNIRKANTEELEKHLIKYLNRCSKLGTTTIEVKSGYGLDTENEVKMLRVIEIVKQKLKNKIDVVSTYCGAHAIPKGKTEEEQTQDVITRQIPQIQRLMKEGVIKPHFIDVFCERKFFQAQSSKKIMLAGKKVGMVPSFHGDQLSNLESGSIGAEVGARAISHLEYLSDTSIQKMAQHKIAAVLLPTTQNIEKIPVPPINKMREAGVIMALGSDFCPNAFCYSMQLTMHYACVNYRLTPQEALVAATLNSAYALQKQHQVGSIEQGKKGDFLVTDQESWRYLMYSFGFNSAKIVIKQGVVVSERTDE